MKRTIGHVVMTLFLALSIPSVVSADGEKILVFKDSLAYSGHQAAIKTCLAKIRQWGADSGFSVDTTIHLSSFSSANLANYDAVVMLYPYRQDPNNSSQWYNDTMNASQDSAFKNFMLSGKGYVGVHCGSRLNNNWPWFLDTFLGVQYTNDQGPFATTYHVTDPNQSMTKGIPTTFTDNQQIRSENLFFSDTDKTYTVLINADSNDYKTHSAKLQKFYPYVYMHDYEGARIWEGDMGHDSATWNSKTPAADTIWRKLLLRGILYALNRTGQSGPAAPALTLPANGSIGVSTSPTLSWGTVGTATAYGVQVSTSTTFATTVTNQSGLTAPSLGLSGLTNSMTYYWRANAANTGGTSAWSSVWSFVTIIAPPSAPILALPTNGSIGQATSVTVSWGMVTNAASYALQVSMVSTFGSTVSNQTALTTTSGVISGLSGNTTYYWRANATNAAGTSAWSSVWSFTTTSVQTIPLPVGWGMKSLNVRPLDSSMAAVFGTDTSFFLFVKNNSGNIYSPFLGIADLSSVHTGQGYQTYCSRADTIRSQGSRIDAATTAISLPIGWSMIAYFPQDSDTADHALSSIVSNLILAKDYLGNVYAPALGVNSMPRMKPGEGYKVAMSAASVLAYPTSGFLKQTVPGGPKQLLSLPQPTHYLAMLNTGSNATIVAKKVGIGGATAPDSSEVGAFDEQGNLVGSGKVIHGTAVFALWGDDPMTKKVKDGLTSGERVTFRLWTGTQEYPLDFASGEGVPAYVADGLFMGALTVPSAYLISRFDLARAYPNPFKGFVKITFNVPMMAGMAVHDVEINVYDLKGILVQQIAKGKYKAGHYSVTWNCHQANNGTVGSSVYIVRMRAEKFDKRMKVVKLGD